MQKTNRLIETVKLQCVDLIWILVLKNYKKEKAFMIYQRIRNLITC